MFLLRLFGLTNYPVDHSLMMEMEMESHGTYRDHWWLQLGKIAFLARHSCPGSPANLLCIVQRKKKNLALRVSSLCQDDGNLLLK